tara:strand:+ start:457 stop:1014 length:558 start_codon:yes stop_codon:yes gene_type:complete
VNTNIEIEQVNERTIYLQDVDSVNSLSVIDSLEKINKEDRENERVYLTNYKPKPIKMIISSFGGSVYDGLAIIAAMRQSVTEIHTYVFGAAMSMGLPIALMGDKKYADKYATYMFHDVGSGAIGKIADMEMDIKEGKRLRTLLMDIVSDRSVLTKTDMNEKVKLKEDWYFTAKQALKFEVCDEIL